MTVRPGHADKSKEIGLERTLGDHIETMVAVFREIRRVLRKDGTLWVNYGDCYAASINGRSAADTKELGNDDRTFRDKPFSTIGPIFDPDYATPLGLVGSSTNKSHTHSDHGERVERGVRDQGEESILGGGAYAPPGQYPNSKARRSDKQRGHTRRHQGFNDRWDAMGKARQIADGANLRNVWTIPTAAYPEAHFATFPPALVEPCIKAGTSERGCCPHCGAPWRRETETTYRKNRPSAGNDPRSRQEDRRAAVGSHGWRGNNLLAEHYTLGWSPTCQCQAHEPVPCTILDPFAGAGTTGLVAERLGRNSILIELNPVYAEMAKRRIRAEAPLLAKVTIDPQAKETLVA